MDPGCPWSLSSESFICTNNLILQMRKQKPKKPAEPGERSGLLILSPDIFAPDRTLHLFLLYNHSLVVYNVQSSPALEA